MRWILSILIFLSLNSEAQVIRANAFYRPFTAVSFTGILDDYPSATAAYSLRKLDKDYAGSAIRIRRSNDNSEQDIGFTSSGDLDTASLKSFVGSNSGFVTTWYDQSGNGYNATQSTAGQQPRLVNAGTIERRGGEPYLYFLGDRVLNMSIPALTGSYSAFSVIDFSSGQTGFRGIFAINGSPAFMMLGLTGTNWGTFGGSTRAANTDIRGAGVKLLQMEGTLGSSGSFYVNNTSDGTYAASEGQTDHIGGQSGQLMVGYLSEIILWNSTPSRSGVAGNINTYYGIY